jgi:hypothetical protein
MTTTMSEIARSEWAAFFDAFSRRRLGWNATLEVLGPEFGAQTEAHALAFVGVVACTDSLSILLGDDLARHVTRSVVGPVRVRIGRTETERCVTETLEIESDDGTVTLLGFEE